MVPVNCMNCRSMLALTNSDYMFIWEGECIQFSKGTQVNDYSQHSKTACASTYFVLINVYMFKTLNKNLNKSVYNSDSGYVFY